ncbi:hypothetical protein [Microbulbifer sp.]|uniref:hypothetical protein n=1 Tax=Microbulbifer sp. TaxID=1908541 RepID=UPI002F93A3EB
MQQQAGKTEEGTTQQAQYEYGSDSLVKSGRKNSARRGEVTDRFQKIIQRVMLAAGPHSESGNSSPVYRNLRPPDSCARSLPNYPGAHKGKLSTPLVGAEHMFYRFFQ